MNPENPSPEGFPLSDLTKRMGSSRSKRIVGIVDACYSGATNLPSSALKKKSAVNAAKIAIAKYDKIYENTPKTKGLSLLLSSQSYEPSNAVEGRNSLYTGYLIEGFKGVKDRKDENGVLIPGSVDKCGNVTPDSLHGYVYYKVASVARQVPEIKSDKSSQIVLAFYPLLGEEIVEKAEQQIKQALPDGFDEEIEQKAKQIELGCNSFYELRKSIETGKSQNVSVAEINETGELLKSLYSKSERLKTNSNWLTKQYEKGVLDSDTYERRISIVAEEMAKIEFEFKESVFFKLDKVARELETTLKSSEQPGKIHQEKIIEGTVLGKMGETYSSTGQHQKAIEYYTQAQEIAKLRGDQNEALLWQHKLKGARKQLECKSILFLPASPIGTNKLALDMELSEIENEIRISKYSKQISFSVRFTRNLSDITREFLLHTPQIVHFSGHGSNELGVMLEDENGLVHPLDNATIAKLFSTLKGNIRCVVLDACYSASQAKVISSYVDYVIGISNAIGDEGATRFAQGFYQGICYGKDFETAFNLGCLQINLAGLSENDAPQIFVKEKTEKSKE